MISWIRALLLSIMYDSNKQIENVKGKFRRLPNPKTFASYKFAA